MDVATDGQHVWIYNRIHCRARCVQVGREGQGGCACHSRPGRGVMVVYYEDNVFVNFMNEGRIK